MDIRSAIASIPSVGEVLNVPRIHIAALLCILPRALRGYAKGACL